MPRRDRTESNQANPTHGWNDPGGPNRPANRPPGIRRSQTPHPNASRRGPSLAALPERPPVVYLGWNRSEMEFTQWRTFRGVKRSPSNT